MELSNTAGWLFAAAAVAFFYAAFATRFRWLGVAGAAAALPFFWQASRFPLLHWLAIISMMSTAAAAVLLLRRRPDVAFAALSPALMIAAALAVFALRGIHLAAPDGERWRLPLIREMVAKNESVGVDVSSVHKKGGSQDPPRLIPNP